MSNISTVQFLCIICSQYKSQTIFIYETLYGVSVIYFLSSFYTNPPPGQCAGGTHPTGMHSCVMIVSMLLESRYISDVRYLLPPATKLGQSYVFTRVCDSVHGVGGVVVGIPACIARGIPACLAAGVWGGMVSQHALQVSRPTPKGKVEGSGQGGSPGGACSWGGVTAPGGCLLQGGGGVETPSVMATTASGTLPTGMRSCVKLFQSRLNIPN